VTSCIWLGTTTHPCIMQPTQATMVCGLIYISSWCVFINIVFCPCYLFLLRNVVLKCLALCLITIIYRSEISLDTVYLPSSLWVCLHVHQPAQPSHTFSGVDLSWHCAFRITFATMHVSRLSNHTTLWTSFFLHFLRLPATFSLGYVSPHIQPAFFAVFCWIRFIYCRLT